MRVEDIKKVAVIGAGTMGSQIVEVFSRVAGYETHMVDLSDELVNQGLRAIDERLERYFVSKDRMSAEEKQATLGRIRCGTSVEEAVKDVDFAVEAVVENLRIKREVFGRLHESTRPDVVLASNTSGLNITEMGAATGRPDKVVGTHFFYPVAVMPLVEVVRGAHTSDETVEFACELARHLGKEPVVCRDVSFGFLANRVYGRMTAEAVQMVWERVAPPAEIDRAVKLGYSLLIGPLELADMIGSWGLSAWAEEDRIRELGPDRGRLHPLVRAMVRAGYTGGRGKKGIYDFYNDVLSKW